MRWKIFFIIIAFAVPLIYGEEITTTTTSASSTEPTTISTTTIQATTTTTLPVSTTPKMENSTKPTLMAPSNRSDFLNTTSYSCSCDLTLNCDVNCCCDIDCSEEFLKAFRCVEDVNIDDYHFGEGLERCEINNGLFCIMRDNLEAPDYYLKAPGHDEYSKYHWPASALLRNDREPSNELVREFYKYGDSIMAYDTKADTLDTIKIPATLTDSTCHWREPIKFLHTKHVKCLKTVNELCSFNSNFMMKLVNAQLFHRPSHATETREASDGFNIKIQSCKHSLINCTQIKTSEDGVGDFELLGDEVFDEVRVEFLINDTSLLSATVTFFTHHDEIICGTDELGPSKMVQTIDVRFKNVNEKNVKRVRSKSRGYKDEELILMSKLLPVNQSLPNGETVFEYFHKNDTVDFDFRMRIPENRDGKCVMTEDVHDLVRFNENSQTFCKVELVRNDTLNETLCQQSQRQVSNYLFNMMNLTFNGTQVNHDANIYVSKFWSPRYEAATWSKVDLRNAPLTSPEMQETENFITCSKMIQTVKFSFHTKRVRSSKAKSYENVIESLVVDFGAVSDVKFPIDTENQTISMDILIQFQFYNSHGGLSNDASIYFHDLSCVTILCAVVLVIFQNTF